MGDAHAGHKASARKAQKNGGGQGSRSARAADAERPSRSDAHWLRQMPFGVIEWSSDHTVVDWNAEAERIFGYTRSEAMGRHAAGLVTRRSRSEIKHAWGSRIHEQTHEVSEAVTKDGQTLSCEWWSTPVQDGAGQITGSICIVHDVTQRERSWAKLKEQEHLLRAVTKNVPLVLWAVDSHGVFTYQDGKGLERAGLKPMQFVGQNVFDLYASDVNAVNDMRRALAGQPIHFQSDAHGICWDSWLIPVASDDKNVTSMIGLTLDVTELRRVEKELQSRIELIERQQKVIRDLSIPIIQVWDGVLVLPMVGMVDSGRIAEVMDNLLSQIIATGARYAILDLTGIDTIDTSAANHLVMLIRSIQLVGAQGIITGIRPTVAQTVVSLGVDLGAIKTLANLRDGLKLCMSQAAR